MAYDVTLGEIEFPTFEQDFTETIGSDYQLVGSAVMPGPPRPASLYSFTLNIYGDGDEPDRTDAGFDKRDELRSLIQDAALRYAGLEFTVAFDPALDGYLVIGTGDLAYAIGGATFGDFTFRVNQAVWIPAPLTIQAMVTRDAFLMSPDLSSRVRSAPDPGKMRHYLPVGASNVRTRYGARPEVKEYRTIDGKGVYVEGATPGEILYYDQDWSDVLRGRVRIWDRRGREIERTDRAGDAFPGRRYGWARAFGPTWRFKEGSPPVIDNGRCRVLCDADGSITIQTLHEGAYGPHGAVQTGYGRATWSRVVSWTPEMAVVSYLVEDKGRSGEVQVTLGRGWEGPQVDVQHFGEQEGFAHEAEGDAPITAERVGEWEHIRIGRDADHRARTEHRVARRSR